MVWDASEVGPGRGRSSAWGVEAGTTGLCLLGVHHPPAQRAQLFPVLAQGAVSVHTGAAL